MAGDSDARVEFDLVQCGVGCVDQSHRHLAAGLLAVVANLDLPIALSLRAKDRPSIDLAASDRRQLRVISLLVDAKDDQAEAFYRRFGFLPLQQQPRRRFLPMKIIAGLFDV